MLQRASHLFGLYNVLLISLPQQKQKQTSNMLFVHRVSCTYYPIQCVVSTINSIETIRYVNDVDPKCTRLFVVDSNK